MSKDQTTESAAEAYALGSGYKMTYDRMRLFEGFIAGAAWAETQYSDSHRYREALTEVERLKAALTKLQDSLQFVEKNIDSMSNHSIISGAQYVIKKALKGE